MKHISFVATYLAITSLLVAGSPLYAQNNRLDVTKYLNYNQPVTPVVLDNYNFSTYDAAGKKAYNLKGFEIAGVGGKIIDLKVNPAGASYALLFNSGKQNSLKVFDIYKSNNLLFDFKKTISPVSIAYSADSRLLYVVDTYSSLKVYDSRGMQLIDQWSIPEPLFKMTTSNNGYFIAGCNGADLFVLNPTDKSVRFRETYKTSILDFSFSEDSSLLAILLADGEIVLLNTRGFTDEVPSINRPGASAVAIHPDNKYIALAKNGHEVEVVNISNPLEAASLAEPDGNVSYVRFLKDGNDNIYLTFNALKAVKYRLLRGLTPNYTKLIREEVMMRMEEWSKMAEGETEEQYLARVNDESRLLQARLFEEEIATRMADELVTRSEVRLGAYNPSSNTLSLEFDNMPPIFLNVPESEMKDFMDVANLEFRNPIYGVTAEDKFELVYANVYNKKTGKSYEFNNRERKSLDYLYVSDQFVPIELVRQSGMEEVKLTDIKNSVVKQARKDNLISEHTNINVSTNISNDVDANGKQITNYKVSFKYTVDGGYSAKEDFPAGKYKISQSNAANSLLKIVSHAFHNDFAQYVKPGKKVIIKISGSADALPIQGKILYDGSYGEFINEPYLLGKELSSISLTKADGIRTNEQLAFTRAMAVKDYICDNLPEFRAMNTDFIYSVEVSTQKGGEFRRISVEFTFVDAF